MVSEREEQEGRIVINIATVQDIKVEHIGPTTEAEEEKVNLV